METRRQWNTLHIPVEMTGISDYISNLPDPLLCHILACIPTKSAVATCILSKRWKTVWTKVPKLDFTEMPHLGSCCFLGPREKMFEDFVDKVLSSNDMSSIKILILHLYNDLRPRDSSSWLRDIAKRDIQEVDLTCHCPSLKLPPKFFSKDKLVVLKLTCFSLDVPDSLHWPSLEYLHLIHAHFNNEKSLKNLLLGSPVLKEFAIDSCTGISKLCITSSSLKTLEIKSTLKAKANVNRVLVIEAPNLDTLYLSDLADRYDLSSISLDKAVLTIHDRGVNHREKLVELLKGICSLKTLKLGRVTIEVLRDLLDSRLPAFRNINLPVFHNLVYLEMTVGSWSIVLQMLDCTPNLISLVIYNNCYSAEKDWSPVPSLPKCLSFSLQEISIHHLTRDEVDMKMAECLLRHTIGLKKLKFSMVPYPCSEGYADVVELFRELSSGSSECEILHCQS
ncbi:hypothetical protein V2J09_022566 [Rumex salicifolius]